MREKDRDRDRERGDEGQDKMPVYARRDAIVPYKQKLGCMFPRPMIAEQGHNLYAIILRRKSQQKIVIRDAQFPATISPFPTSGKRLMIDRVSAVSDKVNARW